jgi:hypothetical protein
MSKFLIYSEKYNPTSGGAICLHYLCHILNDLGHEAYLVPDTFSFEFSMYNIRAGLRNIARGLGRIFKKYKTNPSFNTPVIKNIGKLNLEEFITIYPETTFGNPISAKNVVRWLLHNPGFHTGKINYGKNELYFKFNQAISDFHHPGSTLSSVELKIIRYPLEHYNMENSTPENLRKGTAYCMRKGQHKIIQHDLNNSTLVDDLSHEEISKIFKSVKTFISYDSLTAYSIFAVLCGCDSIVIPDNGVSESNWYPNPVDRYGIAYGFENLEKSRSTRHLVKNRIDEEHNKNYINAAKFVEQSEKFFFDASK